MRLTKETIASLRTDAQQELFWDDKVTGLGVRVTRAGAKSWILNYRTADRVMRRQTLGKAEVLHPDTARKMARELLVSVARGADPLTEHKVRVAEPTVAELEAAFTPEHTPSVKPSTREGNASLWRSQLLPRLGKRKVRELDAHDIAELLHDMRATPYVANRCVRLLSKAYAVAAKRWRAWGWPAVERNPCKGAELHPEKKRERYLAPEELRAFLDALDSWPSTPTQWRYARALRLLLLTGCRRGEWLRATWDMVDEPHALLRLPDSKTGSKDVHLPAEALVVLGELRERSNSAWVIGGDGDGPISGYSKLWKSFLAHAGLSGLRMHDIRHSYASLGVAAGLSLPQIGGLLGHKSAQTTARYAHLMRDTGRAASAAVVETLAAATKKEPPTGRGPI